MIARSVQGKIMVFAVFLIGIATGVLATNFYSTRVSEADSVRDVRGSRTSQERQIRDLDGMSRYLGLDQSQQDQIRKILEGTRVEMRKLREQTEPQFKDIQDRSREKIRSVLNEDQRAKSDAFWESRNKRERERRPPRPGDRDDKDKH
jgi:hypothetical protein